MGRDYIGVSAYGLKMGAVVPGTDLKEEVLQAVGKCEQEGLVDEGDILCVTEAVVAKSQNNYVQIDEIAEEIRASGILPDSTILVLYPIASRNRFSAILRGIARAVNEGKVIVQMSFPTDEVGNRIVDAQLDVNKTYRYERLKTRNHVDFDHPITGVNYLEYYKDIIESESSDCEIVLCNRPAELVEENLDQIIVSSIHSREKDRLAIENEVDKLGSEAKIIDLTEFFDEGARSSNWGLLGSNLSTGEKLKLAPKAPFDYARNLQKAIVEKLGMVLEVLIFGDGAYKDPESGIYELADPVTAFGYTEGLEGNYRRGNKYKYLVDKYIEQGYTAEEISQIIEEGQVESEDEGTTPRRVKDLVASLADLVAGSADAGTPAVLIKNFL